MGRPVNRRQAIGIAEMALMPQRDLSQMSQPPLLEITDLQTDFKSSGGAVRAIDGVCLSVGRGEVVALVGESGSGKTLTALSIIRLLPPQAEVTHGSICLDGVDLLSLSEAAMNQVRGARIAMLFQQPKATLDPTSKVGTQVGEALRLHRHSSARAAWRRSVELLADVGIAEPARRAHGYAHQLSGGMAQRAMIAAALSGEPALLIADEPTTALDVTVEAQILKLLMTKRDENNLAILLISHDLGLVSAVADRVAVMYAGRIVEMASTAQVMTDPQHPYTRALLQSSLLSSDKEGRLYTLPGRMPRPNDVQGCRFRSRCTLADELGIGSTCEADEPSLVGCGAGHVARCWAISSSVIAMPSVTNPSAAASDSRRE